MSDPALVIGAGPAGCCSALNLLNLGLDPVIIESANFPRFHIGESLTTECTEALYRLGLEKEMKNLLAPKKNGVRIFSKHPQNSFYVGAGDAWQVERAKFDNMLLNVAKARGVNIIKGQAVSLEREDAGWRLRVKLANGCCKELNARFVVDSSGQSRFSIRQGLFAPLIEGQYARQIAFFSHYENVKKQATDMNDTLIFHRGSHEWCWIIPITESITSVGLVMPVSIYKAQKIQASEFIQGQFEKFSVPLYSRVESASRVAPVRTVSNYSYQVDHYARQGLYCVGDSHRFIDPIFSFGVEFAVVEAEYMGKAVQRCLETESVNWEKHERAYVNITSKAQNIISDLLAYFWAHPWGFAKMAHYRYREEFLEIFAGRIYECETGTGIRKMRMAMT